MNLQDQINSEINAADELLALANGENRAFTAEEQEKYEGHLNEAEKLQGQQKAMEELTAKRAQFKKPVARKAVSKPNASVEVKEPNFVNDPKAGFNKRSDFFNAVIDTTKKGIITDDRLRYLGAAGTDEQRSESNPDGGFLVPEGHIDGVLQVNPEMDPTVGRTTSIPMETSAVTLNSRVDKNHSSSVSGGLTVTRKPETATGSSSKMSFEKITLKANTLFGLTYATDEILEDSPTSLAALLSQGFEQEFASKKFEEKLSGSGTGEFEGVLNSSAMIEVAKEGGQAADTIQFENIIKMYSRMYGKNNAIWLANHDVLPQLADLGSDTTIKNIWMPSAADGVPATLMGKPIYFTEYLPTLGDKNDIIFCDWSQYLEGMYKPRTSASSIHVRFVEGEQAFRFTERCDARSWWKSALTPKKGSSLSPFVGLAARA